MIEEPAPQKISIDFFEALNVLLSISRSIENHHLMIMICLRVVLVKKFHSPSKVVLAKVWDTCIFIMKRE